MYHGEGPKNIQALFHAAERDKALLFIDKADLLLSKRITNVTQGSEIVANSIRSQLQLCLEQPVERDVDVHELAKYEGLCGRNIKNIVVQAALSAVICGASAVSLSDFEGAIEEALQSKQSLRERSSGDSLSQEQQENIAKHMVDDEKQLNEDHDCDDEEWVCDDDYESAPTH